MMIIAHKLVITTSGYLRTTNSCKGGFFNKALEGDLEESKGGV